MAATFLASIVWNNAAKEVTQPWGWSTVKVNGVYVEPPYQDGHWHCGIDIGLYSGTPIFAARAGRVTHRTKGVLGITTTSDQTDYYVHGTASVLLGAIVARGQMLGWSGNIVPGGGAVIGAGHLHFEVQPPGGWLNRPTGLNPVPILSPTQSAGTGTLEVPFMAQLTDAEQADLYAKVKTIYGVVADPTPAQSWPAIHAHLDKLPTIDQVQGRVDQAVGVLKAAIAALPAPGGDYSEVLAAIEHAQEILDKIDRGE